MTDNISRGEKILIRENNIIVTTVVKNKTIIKIRIKQPGETNINKYRNAEIIKRKRLIIRQENCQISKNYIIYTDTIKKPTEIINARLDLKSFRWTIIENQYQS